MTARSMIIIGFAVIGVLVAVAVLYSHLRRDRVTTLSATLDYLVRGRPARVIAILVWAWLGWHFLAR